MRLSANSHWLTLTVRYNHPGEENLNSSSEVRMKELTKIAKDTYEG